MHKRMTRIFCDREAKRRLLLVSGEDSPPDLTWPQRVRILAGVSRAIEYLHTADLSLRKKEVLHRDIKPSNILLDRDLEPRLADVGMARDVAGGGSQTTSMLVGSNGYVDPCVLRSGRYDKKNDGYAFGVTMLQVLTGWPVDDQELGDNGCIIDRCSERGLEIENTLPGGMWARLLKIALDLVKPSRGRRMSVHDARQRLDDELGQIPVVPAAHDPVERECILCLSAPREMRTPAATHRLAECASRGSCPGAAACST